MGPSLCICLVILSCALHVWREESGLWRQRIVSFVIDWLGLFGFFLSAEQPATRAENHFRWEEEKRGQVRVAWLEMAHELLQFTVDLIRKRSRL